VAVEMALAIKRKDIRKNLRPSHFDWSRE